MTCKSCCLIFAASFLVLAPSARAFAPRSASSVNLAKRINNQRTGLEMKNMFSHEEDVSLDSMMNLFSKKKPIQTSESPLDSMMNLFRKNESVEPSYMEQQGPDMTTLLALGTALAGAVAVATLGIDLPNPSDVLHGVENLIQDPNAFLQDVIQNVESMGPLGIAYFGLFYTVAEVLCVPALPLTASAGYLFGLAKGTAVVLTSASVAAAIAFVIGRTFLRSFVEEKLEEYPEFAKIDKAIGKEGLKLMILLRLSPIFPFSLSNYLYGASSVGFWQYFIGTMIGFAPGTMAYVYSGEIGKTLTSGSETQPWYLYAGGMVLVAGLLKLVADVATTTIQAMEEEA